LQNFPFKLPFTLSVQKWYAPIQTFATSQHVKPDCE